MGRARGRGPHRPGRGAPRRVGPAGDDPGPGWRGTRGPGPAGVPARRPSRVPAEDTDALVLRGIALVVIEDLAARRPPQKTRQRIAEVRNRSGGNLVVLQGTSPFIGRRHYD